MTDAELEAQVSVLADAPHLEHLAARYVALAKDLAVSRLWPFDPSRTWADVPERLHPQVAHVALYLLERRGSEGEVRHSEAGVTAQWERAGVPNYLWAGFTPYAGVPE